MDLRGQDYELHIKGTDELRVRQDSVMAEACNASFQVHLQVSPAEFANLYNVAQLLAGPVLACATNSPVLFGKRLWAETRIALFEQSVDTRRPGRHLRERSPRVTFGTGWVRDSVAELYREDITRHRPVLAPDDYDDPFEAMAEGRPPNLSALLLHTGTVWRWNRACYGVSNGIPHLRIENRVLPSGPSTVDEVANAALWLGLMRAVGTLHHDVSRLMEFEQARANLVAAARQGLAAHLTWLDGEDRTAVRARPRPPPPAGRRRPRRGGHRPGRPGSLPRCDRAAHPVGAHGLALAAHVARRPAGPGVRRAAAEQRHRGDGGPPEGGHAGRPSGPQPASTRAADGATTSSPSSSSWSPIWSPSPRTTLSSWPPTSWTGIASAKSSSRTPTIISSGSSPIAPSCGSSPEDCRRVRLADVPVGEVMRRNPVCVPPDIAPLRALELMRSFGIGALPVVHGDQLVGLVTEHDFMNVAGVLLLQQLTEANPQ